MRVNIITNTNFFWSMLYVAKLFQKFLREHYNIYAEISNKYKDGYHNILIHETWDSLIQGRKAEVYWTDTPLPAERIQSFYLNRIYKNLDNLFDRNYAISNSNKLLMERYNIRVDDVIPRLINDDFFMYNTYYSKSEYDLIFIGKVDECDRKNVRLVYEIGKRTDYRILMVVDKIPTFVRSIPKNITIAKYGSLTDEEKAKLFSKSKYLIWLSWYEGFGMPVLEAMAIGLPVIYSNVPAHNEFAVGFSVSPSDSLIVYCYGLWVKKFNFNIDDIIKVVDHAMSLSKDEYQDLSERAKNKSIEVYNEFVEKSSMLI